MLEFGGVRAFEAHEVVLWVLEEFGESGVSSGVGVLGAEVGGKGVELGRLGFGQLEVAGLVELFIVKHFALPIL
jgi:hypothetical protein